MDKPRGNVSQSDTPRRNQGSSFVHQESRGATRVRLSTIRDSEPKAGFGFRPSTSRGKTRVRLPPIQETRVRISSIQGPGVQLGFVSRPSRKLGFGFCPSGAENAVWMDNRRGKVSPMDKPRGNVSPANGAARQSPASKQSGATTSHQWTRRRRNCPPANGCGSDAAAGTGRSAADPRQPGTIRLHPPQDIQEDTRGRPEAQCGSATFPAFR